MFIFKRAEANEASSKTITPISTNEREKTMFVDTGVPPVHPLTLDNASNTANSSPRGAPGAPQSHMKSMIGDDKLVTLILCATVAFGFATNNIKPRRGALIWEDNYNTLNKTTWKHLITGWEYFNCP